MENLLVSACLLGCNCKYDGGNNRLDAELLAKLEKRYRLVPVCPESDGGLPVPRTPSERLEEHVITADGTDVTEQFALGAEIALGAAQSNACRKALLKERSPSCGYGEIYDGTFSGTLVRGNGVTADLLEKHGIIIVGESKIKEITEGWN